VPAGERRGDGAVSDEKRKVYDAGARAGFGISAGLVPAETPGVERLSAARLRPVADGTHRIGGPIAGRNAR